MPMHVGVDLERALELVARRGPRRARRGRARAPRACSVGEVVGVERGDDQQDRVGAGRRRLVELVGVDDEVLAQDRQARSPRAPRAGRRASRRSGGLGEDRQRRGAAALVGLRRCRSTVAPSRIVAGATASGACARRSARCPGAPAPRRTAGPRGRSASAASSSASGTLAPAALDLVARGLDDAVEDAHATGASSPRQRDAARRAPRAAAPESIAASAARTPSSSVSARPGDVDRGAGVEHREVARAGRARRRGSARVIAALSLGRAAGDVARARAGASPTSSGATRSASIAPPSTSTTCVGARRAHLVQAVRAGHYQRPVGAQARQRARDRARGTPGRRRRSPGACAPAGLVSGPRKLKIVRTASSLRTGTTKRVAPWWAGANMKPKPTSSMQRATASGREVDAARRAPRARRPSPTARWPSGCRAWPPRSRRRRRSAPRSSRR